ncbi:hit domain-containing protein [Xylariaceae sp. FL0016]|nr:hit domain-containing protein [Xylariaceae sp. FL0016]
MIRTRSTCLSRSRPRPPPSSNSWHHRTITMASTATKPDPGPIHFGPFEVTTQVFLTTPLSFALVNLKPLLPGHVLVCPRRPHQRLTQLSPAELTDLFTSVQRVQRMLAAHYFTRSAAKAINGHSAHPHASPYPSAPGTPVATRHVQTSPLDHEGGGEAAAAREEEEEGPPPGPPPVTSAANPAAGSFNIAIQDGADAGQTVSHVHVHVIPRIRGATSKDRSGPGDEIYEQMAAEDGNVGGALWDRARAEEEEEEKEQDVPERPRPGGGFPRIEDQSRMPRSKEEMEAEAEMFREVLRHLEG